MEKGRNPSGLPLPQPEPRAWAITSLVFSHAGAAPGKGRGPDSFAGGREPAPSPFLWIARELLGHFWRLSPRGQAYVLLRGA